MSETPVHSIITVNEDKPDEKKDVVFDFSENHAWIKLEKVTLPTHDIEHICDSDDENYTDAKEEGTQTLSLEPVDATEGLVLNDTKTENTKQCESEYSYSDDDEGDDDDDEVEELLEETLFALQNDYYFVRRIVCHGFVSIYKAVDRKTGERVCVKLVARHGISTLIDRLPIEARILACIASGPEDHIGKEFLQKPTDYYSSPYTYVIVSKLYKEASFKETLFDNPVDIKTLMKQLLHAIDYLHSIGIMSRDIKNSNLLWDRYEKKVILCDFDLSSFITEKGHCVTLGTDGYIAPEVLLHDEGKKSNSRYSKEIDIYSAGVVFGSLLHVVRENDLTTDVVSAWVTKLKRRRNHLSPQQNLLRKMICADPKNRPSARECLEHDYFKV